MLKTIKVTYYSKCGKFSYDPKYPGHVWDYVKNKILVRRYKCLTEEGYYIEIEDQEVHEIDKFMSSVFEENNELENHVKYMKWKVSELERRLYKNRLITKSELKKSKEQK